MQKPFCLFTFNSRNYAAGAMVTLKRAGIEAAIMPTPRSLTASCGLAVRVAPEDGEEALKILAAFCGRKTINVYSASIEGGRPVYKETELNVH